MPSIHLTAQERPFFEALAKALTSEWTVEAETGTAYETLEVLKMRADISPLSHHPQAREIFDQFQNGADLQRIAMPDLSEEDIAEFFFTIGARGLSTFIGMLVQDAKTDEDVRAISEMTQMRHRILETNASISYL